jgi:hypothetical protein
MPLPLAIAPAAAGLGKLGVAIKGLFGAGKAAAGLSGAKQLAIPGLMGAAKGGKMAAVKRFAGQALNDYMGPGGITPGNIAMNFGPDLLFGGMSGVMTPGDLGDKLIAGTTTAVGGAMGGVGAVSMLGKNKNSPAFRIMGEMGGGIAGDMVGQGVGDSLMRIKGGGMTPYEREAMARDAEYRRQIESELISQGLV